MSSVVDTCALCPKLCRHVCPVSVGTGLESATPTAILTEVLLAEQNPEHAELASQAIDLCTRCGACADFLAEHHHRLLWRYLYQTFAVRR